jgi:hypothetical protein
MASMTTEMVQHHQNIGGKVSTHILDDGGNVTTYHLDDVVTTHHLDDGENDETVPGDGEEAEGVEEEGQAPLVHPRLVETSCTNGIKKSVAESRVWSTYTL